MKSLAVKHFLVAASLIVLSVCRFVNAQSMGNNQAPDYYDLKGMLLNNKATVESLLKKKRFILISNRDKVESTIYGFKLEDDSTRILVRVRKRDGLVNEIAWSQNLLILGSLIHDVANDGLVPVAGNGRYYNRSQKIALWINYTLAYKSKVVPCILRAVE